MRSAPIERFVLAFPGRSRNSGTASVGAELCCVKPSERLSRGLGAASDLSTSGRVDPTRGIIENEGSTRRDE
jgi:hypothetical protein